MDSTASLPNLSWLRSFEAAARHLNFTAAAKELNMTQAALSKQVRLLELHFGEALFIRKSRTLELTKLGKSYYPKIHQSLRQIQTSTNEVFGSRHKNHLTIAVIESFAQAWLLPRLAEFTTKNPNISLRILSSNWVRIGEGEAYDFQFNYGPQELPNITSVQITNEALIPVVTPNKKRQLGPEPNLDGETLIHVMGYQNGWPKWLETHGVFGDFNAIHADSSQVAYTLACNEMGIALGRRTVVAPYLADGRLVPLFDDWLDIDEGFFLRYRDAPVTKAAEQFRNWILSVIDS